MAPTCARSDHDRLAALYRELERFILTRAVKLIRESRRMPAPHDDIKGLVYDIRAKVAQATARAKAVKARGDASMREFHGAVAKTEAFLDEVDAATAEMTGTLQGTDTNGGPALDAVGNLPTGSQDVGAEVERYVVETLNAQPELASPPLQPEAQLSPDRHRRSHLRF